MAQIKHSIRGFWVNRKVEGGVNAQRADYDENMDVVGGGGS